MSSDSASSRPKYPRPSVVTLSCVFVAVTAFLTLTELVSALMDWATVDMQAWLRPVLRQLAEAGAVLTMPEVLEYLRWAFLVMVPFAVAAMVFAIYALRGDRTARVMTTVLAVFAGFVSLPIGIFGVIQAGMLFAAASALWTSDARRWYRGEPPPEAPAAAVAALSPPDAPQLPGAEVTDVKASPLPAQRPASVMVAGLVTIFGSLIAGGFAGLYLLVTTFARQTYLDAFESSVFRDMMTAQELERSMQLSFWVSTAILPLALIGLVAGSALLSRRPVARSLTLWWAWVTVAVGVLALPLIILGVVVILLLRRDDARRWTASRGSGGTDNLTA